MCKITQLTMIRFYGVMVSTQDSEFCDQSSNLSRTYSKFFLFFFSFNSYWQHPDTGLVESFPVLSGPVAQRIRHLTTNQGIAGSSPARVNCLFCQKQIVSYWLDLCWPGNWLYTNIPTGDSLANNNQFEIGGKFSTSPIGSISIEDQDIRLGINSRVRYIY